MELNCLLVLLRFNVKEYYYEHSLWFYREISISFRHNGRESTLTFPSHITNSAWHHKIINLIEFYTFIANVDGYIVNDKKYDRVVDNGNDDVCTLLVDQRYD